MALAADDPQKTVLIWIGGLTIAMDSVNTVVENAPPEPYKVLVGEYLDEKMRVQMVEELLALIKFLDGV